MGITHVSLIANRESDRWRVMLMGWKEEDDDPSIEEEDWADGESAEEALAHATIRLGTHWKKLEEVPTG